MGVAIPLLTLAVTAGATAYSANQAKKAAKASRPLAITPAAKTNEDPFSAQGAGKARLRAALAARAAGKSRFRVDTQPDLQTPIGSGGLQVRKR